MATIKEFEDLNCWQMARDFCKLVNTNINLQQGSLRDQIHRSSGSIMDNIAEGFERMGKKEFLHFLTIAKASAAESRSQLYRCFDLNKINEFDFNIMIQLNKDLTKTITGLIKYLKTTEYTGYKFKEEEVEYETTSNFKLQTPNSEL